MPVILREHPQPPYLRTQQTSSWKSWIKLRQRLLPTSTRVGCVRMCRILIYFMHNTVASMLHLRLSFICRESNFLESKPSASLTVLCSSGLCCLSSC